MLEGSAGGISSTVRGFDAVAGDYDRICASPLFARARADVHRMVAESFHPGERVLEIGCGTGIDGEFLVSRGLRVVATDPSPRMLERARARLGDRVALLACGLDRIDAEIERRLPPGAAFDGIFSDFGALNCVDDLAPLASLAKRRLARGGRIVVCLISRACLFEIAAHLALGRPRVAFRRLVPRAGAVLVEVGGETVPTWYHGVGGLRRALGPGFVVRKIRGLGVAVPPAYLESLWSRVPGRLQRLLEAVDALVAETAPFNRLGDHVAVEIVKQ